MEWNLDHIVLNVKDINKMIRFYTEVLSLAPERLEKYQREEVPFPSVRINSDTIIDFFPKKFWGKSSPSGKGWNNLNHLCLSLKKEEWKKLRERLNANNIAIEDGPVSRWGAHGTGTSIYFRDPENNLIETRYYNPEEKSKECLLDS